MRGLAAFKRLLDQEVELARKIAATRAKLAKHCTHPEEFVTDYPWEHDNGYGRQTKHVGKFCRICRAKNLYGRWSQGHTEV